MGAWDVLGLVFLISLVWWLIQKDESPAIIKILGPVALVLWIAGHLLRAIR